MDTLVKETAQLVSRGLPDEGDRRRLVALLAEVRAGLDAPAR